MRTWVGIVGPGEEVVSAAAVAIDTSSDAQVRLANAGRAGAILANNTSPYHIGWLCGKAEKSQAAARHAQAISVYLHNATRRLNGL